MLPEIWDLCPCPYCNKICVFTKCITRRLQCI